MSFRALAAAVLVARAAGAPAATSASPARHVDPDAMREVQRGGDGRYASPRAISHYLEARRHARAGDDEKAVEHLRLAVAYDEESPELRVSLAEELALTGQVEAAEGEARHALELTRSGPSASDAHVLLGRLAASRRRPEQAMLAYRNAIRIESALGDAGEPVDAEPWRLLAALYLEGGDEDAAVRTLEDLARHQPGDATGFREAGRAYLEKRDPGRAERHLRRAVAIDPRDVEAWRLLAQAHEALRRAAEAHDDLAAIVRVDPDDDAALLALGRLAVRQGDPAQAKEWFHRHVRASPEPADAYVRVVFVWLEAHLGADALAAARAGIAEVGPDPRLCFAEGIALQELRRWAESAEALGAVRPDAGELFVSARAALAEALSRSGRHADAERALEAPLATSPMDARLLTTRATVLDRAGRPADSVALLRKALADRAASAEDVPDLYAALADSLFRAGRAEEAVTALRGAVATRPADETLLYALGSAYERAGQSDAAVAQMRALLAVDPDHAEAMNFIGYSYAEQGVRLEEAERLVRRALELKPRSGHLLDSLGWVLFRRGDARGAIDALERADALAGPDPTILDHLGDAYRAAGRAADAARAWRRALATPDDEPAAEQARRRAAIEKKLRDVGAPADRPARR